jgi:sugar phosphate isomerase/epimerase
MSSKRRFKHSVGYWCLHDTEWKWSPQQICDCAKSLEIESIELLPADLIPFVIEQGLGSALGVNGMPDPPFVKGLNNKRHHEKVISLTTEAIKRCAKFGIPNVIAFTGYKWADVNKPNGAEISLKEGAANCVEGLRELAKYGEQNKVTICLEHLNTRDASHPMKGHPGYQGDSIEYCADIVRRVDSPRVKLLFDIYHVQVMHGDVIRRIREYGELIGHIHTGGSPGRGELDDDQEIHYPGIARALDAINYQGFIGHEFIPRRDPAAGLAEAIGLCDTA